MIPAPAPEFEITDDQWHAIGRGWRKLLADNNLELLASEATVVVDDLRQAGSLDRIARCGTALHFDTPDGSDRLSLSAGEVPILDIKTSALHADSNGVPSYWAKYPMQVEVYRCGRPYNPDTGERGEWPFTVSDRVALIAHFDIDRLRDDNEAVWQLIAVDLEVARQGIAAVEAANAYHSSTKFAMPDRVTVVAADGAHRAGVANAAPRAEVERPAEPGGLPTPGSALTATQLAESVTGWNESLRRMLAAEWPATLPTPGQVRRGVATWEGEELQHARAVIAGVLPSFTDDDRTIEHPANPDRFRTPEPTAAVDDGPDDGDLLTDDDLAALMETIRASPVKDIVNMWLRQSSDEGMSFSPRLTPRVRQFEITRAAHALALIDDGGDGTDPTFDAVVREILHMATGSQRIHSFGALLAILTIDEARHVTDAADALTSGHTSLTFTESGQPVLTANTAAPAA